MEFTTYFRSSHGSLPSPNGSLIASLSPPRLVLRDAQSIQVRRIIQLNPDFASRISFVKWSPGVQNEMCVGWNGFPTGKRRSGIDKTEEEGGTPLRLLVADDETIQVYDMKDEKWTATINQGFGGIRNVDFGRNADEIIVFSDYQLKVTVWSLISSKHIEIANPKFPTKAGYGYRPCTYHFALLSRQSTQDMITVHNHTNYRLTSQWHLPTLDAQGLKWSPCGRWIAVWDSPVSGYRVLIYTADGRLYRRYEPKCDGLGVKSVEWSPCSNFLAIGGYDGKLVFLSNYTFSPVIEMNHTSTIRLPGVSVWSETMTSNRERYYSIISQPTSLPIFPCSPAEAHQKLGISTIAFNNPDGHLVASKNDSMPTTVWIWSLKLLRPYAILVHLSPVKSIQWHPTIPDLLLIQCASETEGASSRSSNGVAYLWSSKWRKPRAINVPLENSTGVHSVRWMFTPCPSNTSSASNGTSGSSSSGSLVSDRRSRSPEKECEKKPTIMFADREGFTLGTVEDELADDAEDVRDGMDDDLYGYCDNKRSWNPRDWAFFSPNQNNSTAQTGSIGRSVKASPGGQSADPTSRKPKKDGEEDNHRLSRHHISVES